MVKEPYPPRKPRTKLPVPRLLRSGNGIKRYERFGVAWAMLKDISFMIGHPVFTKRLRNYIHSYPSRKRALITAEREVKEIINTIPHVVPPEKYLLLSRVKTSESFYNKFWRSFKEVFGEKADRRGFRKLLTEVLKGHIPKGEKERTFSTNVNKLVTSEPVGLRIVIEGTVDDCLRIANLLKGSGVYTLTKDNDHLTRPLAHGYRAYHLGGTWTSGENKIPLEVQITTRAFAWQTVMRDYTSGTRFKEKRKMGSPPKKKNQ
jgi:ppGpp synthetase/RelA/SpoT-type nucleotidyltranferase